MWNTCRTHKHKLNHHFLTLMCVLTVHKRMVQIPFQFLTLETVKDRLQCHGNMLFLFWPNRVNRQPTIHFIWRHYYIKMIMESIRRIILCINRVCVCVCARAHIYIYMCVCVYVFVYMYMCVCIWACGCLFELFWSQRPRKSPPAVMP